VKLEDYQKAETTNIDFKVDLEKEKPKSWLKSVSAFANTKGGIILFGIDDPTHDAVGIKNIAKVTEKISELINSRIEPLPRYELNCFKEDGKEFIELEIGDGPITPYFYVADGRKEAFIRSGNQSIPAPAHILQNLILKGKNITFDSLPSEYQIGDLSFTLLTATIKDKTGKQFDKDRDYISLGLSDKNNNLTNAAVLLSDQGALNQSKVVCTRWNGLSKGSIKEDAIDDKEYVGSLISLLENADTFIKNNSKNSWRIKGLDRVEYEDYPITARREAIVNALIHRDYQILGSEIHIDMYDDRLEIVSPGGMIDGTQIQNLEIGKVPSMRRNTIISDIFSRLHYMDRRGSGLSRIIESYNDFLDKPRFLSDESSFTVIFPNKGYSPVLTLNNPVITGQNENIVSDEDYFLIKLYKNLGDKVRAKTLSEIKTFFSKYKYDNTFIREDIKVSFNVKNSRASEIISLLIDNNFIDNVEGSKYKFKR
jgi:ATP-dependent DNA helicase RecG